MNNKSFHPFMSRFFPTSINCLLSPRRQHINTRTFKFCYYLRKHTWAILLTLAITFLVFPQLFTTSSRHPHNPVTAKQKPHDHERQQQQKQRQQQQQQQPPLHRDHHPHQPQRFCDNTNIHGRYGLKKPSQCIFDIGLNTGQDTRAYLAANARVVGVEANPTLISKVSTKYTDDIEQGRLVLVNVGIVGEEEEGEEESFEKITKNVKNQNLTFWVNTANDKFSSFQEYLGCRSENGTVQIKGNNEYCQKIKISTSSCSKLLKIYGTPKYMKIDIEGLDRICLESLKFIQEKYRPYYISIENVWSYDIHLLNSLGYYKFKVINQAQLQNDVGKESEGHSGPWGEDAVDFVVGKNWRSADQILSSLPLPKATEIKGKMGQGWYDLHASK